MNIPPNVPSSLAVLFLFAADGALIGFWYHPNEAALEGRRAQLEELTANPNDPAMLGARVEVVRYTVCAGEA